MRLITYCRRTSADIKGLFPKPYLLAHPFHRAISRIEYKPDLFNYELRSEKISKLIESPFSNQNWADLCDQRALDLLKLNRSHYYFSYSGGIDSTCVMSAILKNWPKAELNRSTILLNHNSIVENPIFFKKYLKNLNLANSLKSYGAQIRDSDSILVTGELGDQLFGSDLLATGCERLGESCLGEDYHVAAPAIFALVVNSKLQAQKIFDHFAPIVNESPIPIKTTHDFFWWLNFSQKWQFVKYRPFHHSSWPLNARYGKNIVHFFDTVDFQNWSLHNPDKKIKSTWATYKYIAKEYIFDFSREASQLELKKVQSLQNLFMLNRIRVAISSNEEEITNEGDLKLYVRKEV